MESWVIMEYSQIGEGVGEKKFLLCALIQKVIFHFWRRIEEWLLCEKLHVPGKMLNMLILSLCNNIQFIYSDNA